MFKAEALRMGKTAYFFCVLYMLRDVILQEEALRLRWLPRWSICIPPRF